MDEKQRAAEIELAVQGDQDALQRLIVHYHGPLRAGIEQAQAGAAGRHFDADDVLQKTYIAAFRSITKCTFEDPGHFYKWLETIARNKLRDEQRAQRRQKRDAGRVVEEQPGAASSYPDLIERIAAKQSTPSQQLAKVEASAAVMSSLARLTEDKRQVVQLLFLESRSVAQTAQLLSKTEPAVHMLTHRGLKELRKLLVSITDYLTHL